MNYKKSNIKNGITLHTINTNKFKTDMVSVFLTTPLNRDTVTLNSLLVSVLRRGNANFPTQELISKNLESLYGAEFNCGIEKSGDNQILKFYIESIDAEFLPKKEEILKLSLDMLIDIILNPLVINNGFKAEYLETEKQTVKRLIENKIDDKSKYSLDRCIEEMHKNKPYGLYKYGYIEDLEKITAESLYNHYKKLIAECKIDIFVSGIIESDVEGIINKNKSIQLLQERVPSYTNKIENVETTAINEIEEKMEVSQGKLIMGLNVQENNKTNILLYNTILRRNCYF